MLMILLLSILAAIPGDLTLVDVIHEDGPFAWRADGDVRRDEAQLVVRDGALSAARPVGGDFAVLLRGERVDGAPTITIDLGQGVVADLGAGDEAWATLRGPGGESGVRAVGAGPFAARLAVRGRFFQLFVDGLPGPELVLPSPLVAGVVRVTVEGGTASFDRARVERSPWFDDVEIVGADAARLGRLSARPLDAFTLLEPLPGRIDPEFRIAVEGEPTPVHVRICGARRPADEIPLIEQALALAGIRAWMVPRLLEGPEGAERVVEGETPFGPFSVTEERVVFVCDALLGCGREWPSLTLWDVEKERIIDRTVPGGPMGRGLDREVPAGVTRMKLVLARPGLDSIEHEIVLRRP